MSNDASTLPTTAGATAGVADENAAAVAPVVSSPSKGKGKGKSTEPDVSMEDDDDDEEDEEEEEDAEGEDDDDDEEMEDYSAIDPSAILSGPRRSARATAQKIDYASEEARKKAGLDTVDDDDDDDDEEIHDA